MLPSMRVCLLLLLAMASCISSSDRDDAAVDNIIPEESQVSPIMSDMEIDDDMETDDMELTEPVPKEEPQYGDHWYQETKVPFPKFDLQPLVEPAPSPLEDPAAGQEDLISTKVPVTNNPGPSRAKLEAEIAKQAAELKKLKKRPQEREAEYSPRSYHGSGRGGTARTKSYYQAGSHGGYLHTNFKSLFKDILKQTGGKLDSNKNYLSWMDPLRKPMIPMTKKERKVFKAAVDKGHLTAEVVPGEKCCFGGQCVTPKTYYKMNDKAVMAGTKWMRNFVERNLNNNVSFALEVFEDIAVPPAQDEEQFKIKTVGYKEGMRLRKFFIDKFKKTLKLNGHWAGLTDVLQILNDDHVMGLKPDMDLIKIADKWYLRAKKAGRLLKGTIDRDPAHEAKLIKKHGKDSLKYTRYLYSTQMDLMVFSLSNYIFHNRWPLPKKYSFAQTIGQVKKLPFPTYVPLGQRHRQDFEQTLYSASHLPLFITYYEAATMTRDQVPWLFTYMEELMPKLMRDRDVELSSEIMDALKITGATVFDSPHVCQAEMWLMHTQKKNGGWAEKTWVQQDVHGGLGPYDVFHVTWPATLGLQHHAPPGHTMLKWLLPKQKAMAKALKKEGLQYHIGPVTKVTT